jgi:hypothetical protein
VSLHLEIEKASEQHVRSLHDKVWDWGFRNLWLLALLSFSISLAVTFYIRSGDTHVPEVASVVVPAKQPVVQPTTVEIHSTTQVVQPPAQTKARPAKEVATVVVTTVVSAPPVVKTSEDSSAGMTPSAKQSASAEPSTSSSRRTEGSSVSSTKSDPAVATSTSASTP